ncbi:MAG: FHA domain-containing protein [Planctomycetaceae bacterium]|nr:MAG: FHA domain-containing protein [Planctomycetaceae bacterium]
MEVILKILNAKANARQVRLQGDTLIGRSSDAQLRVGSAEVSRRHCQIAIRGNAVVIRDLASSNGTRVNGKLIPTGVDMVVAPDSQVEVGPFRFIVSYQPPRNPALTGQKPVSSHPAELPCTPVCESAKPAGRPQVRETDESTTFFAAAAGESSDAIRGVSEQTDPLSESHSESAIELPAAISEGGAPQNPEPSPGQIAVAGSEAAPPRRSLFELSGLAPGQMTSALPSPRPQSPPFVDDTVALDETLAPQTPDPPPAAKHAAPSPEPDRALEDFLNSLPH